LTEHHSWLPDTLHDRNAVAGNGLDEEFACEEFDYEQVFRNLDGQCKRAGRDKFHELGELFRQNLNWIFLAPCGRRRTMRTAFIHFTCLAAALHPELFANLSYQKIGLELGVTKACLSKFTVQMQKRFGIQFSRSRSALGRAHMAAAQLKKHRK
jgi:hypothetical protein